MSSYTSAITCINSVDEQNMEKLVILSSSNSKGNSQETILIKDDNILNKQDHCASTKYRHNPNSKSGDPRRGKKSSSTRIVANEDRPCNHGLGAIGGSCTTTSTTAPPTSVRFDKVIVRNYHKRTGDHPASGRSGVPTSTVQAWKYSPHEIETSVETYESCRVGRRQSRHQVQMPGEVHFESLRNEFNVSIRETLRLQDEVERTQRHNRMKALSQQPRRRRRKMVDEIVKTTDRGFRKLFVSNGHYK